MKISGEIHATEVDISVYVDDIVSEIDWNEVMSYHVKDDVRRVIREELKEVFRLGVNSLG